MRQRVILLTVKMEIRCNMADDEKLETLEKLYSVTRVREALDRVFEKASEQSGGSPFYALEMDGVTIDDVFISDDLEGSEQNEK